MLPKNTKIIRLMPNIPVSVQRGVSVFVPNKLVTGQDIDLINKLLRSVGTCDLVSEYLLDVVTALSGSGPAYVIFKLLYYLLLISYRIIFSKN